MAHRGDHAISRKAIAQGMSDVLRCPVCSCAHSLCTPRMRPRVQRASGIPCALFSERSRKYLQTSGETRREIAKLYPRHLEQTTQHSRDADGRAMDNRLLSHNDFLFAQAL